jgi:hypothetical protein
LPPGKVHLRIFTGNGHSRLIVVDEADVAGMGLKRVQENPKKRLIKQQRMREMGMDVEKKVTVSLPPHPPEDREAELEWC